MGQIEYSENGERLEAFSIDDVEWAALGLAPKGALLMPQTNWPAIAKTSIRGLRFFSHHSGYPGHLPAPESYNHTRLKIEIAKALRSLRYKATAEVAGTSPNGEEWIADVLAESSDGSKIAFEIQFSSQHLADFRTRTARYARSGVKVCWFMPEKPVAWRLAKSLSYENSDYYRQYKEFLCDCEEVLPFTFLIEGKDAYPDPFPSVRFGRGQFCRRLSLLEAVDGMMTGKPRWELPDWKWIDRTASP